MGNTQKHIGITIILLFLVLALGFFTSAFGAEPLPAQVQQSVDAIQDNQQRIAELRPLVKEFDLLKEDNARLIGRMEVFGYSYDWSLSSAKKLDPR